MIVADPTSENRDAGHPHPHRVKQIARQRRADPDSIGWL